MNPEQAKVAKRLCRAVAEGSHVYARAGRHQGDSPFKAFYPAEGYHQNYLTLHPNDGYIAANDIPKVEGLKKIFPQDYKRPIPVLAATN